MVQRHPDKKDAQRRPKTPQVFIETHKDDPTSFKMPQVTLKDAPIDVQVFIETHKDAQAFIEMYKDAQVMPKFS